MADNVTEGGGGSGEIKTGAARAEMEAFIQSFAANLQKMAFLYQAGAAYIQKAYQTMYYNEAQLVAWIMEQMGEV